MNLKDMSIEALKSLAYDQGKIFEQARQNLQILNQRINELEKEKPCEKSSSLE